MSKFLLIPALAIGIGVAGFTLYYFFFKRKSSRKTTLVGSDIKIPLRLVDREDLTHDTSRFKFALTSAEHILGLPIGNHLYLSQRIEGSLVSRAYTPVSDDDQIGYVDLIIKIYKPVGDFNGGKMTTFLDKMAIGDYIDFRGPNGLLEYIGKGKFSIKPEKNRPPFLRKVKKIGMIAGGSGITPMFQIIKYILKHAPEDNTELFLLYANKSENDIILRDELDMFEEQNSNQFRRWYTVDSVQSGSNWSFDVGFVNNEMLRKTMPSKSQNGSIDMVLVCGPPPMVERAVLPSLLEIGYTRDSIFVF